MSGLILSFFTLVFFYEEPGLTRQLVRLTSQDTVITSTVIVRLKNKGDIQEYLKEMESDVVDTTNLSISRKYLDGFYIVKSTPNRKPSDLTDLVTIMANSGDFSNIEYDSYGVRTSTPNDPYFFGSCPGGLGVDQWGLRAVFADDAWDFTTGSPAILMAIIDSGIDGRVLNGTPQNFHVDLFKNIWRNPYESLGDSNGDGYPGIQGVDDDGDGLIDEDRFGFSVGHPKFNTAYIADDDENGYIDDEIGWAFDIDTNSPEDIDKHGTTVSGVSSASTNNTLGVAGVAGGWAGIKGVSLMALRDGVASPVRSAEIEAIIYASDNGARIISMSSAFYGDTALGIPDTEPATFLEEAVAYAVHEKDVVIVATTGPTGEPLAVAAPAAYEFVMGVGGSAPNDVYSPIDHHFWPTAKNIIAPSQACTTDLTVNGSYGVFGGNSISTPYVSGAASLVLSVAPGFTSNQVRFVLEATAQKVPEMDGKYLTCEHGSGLLDVESAVIEALSPSYPTNTIISSVTSQLIHRAYSDIVVSASLPTYADVNLHAGNEIVLSDGATFAANANSELHLYVGKSYVCKSVVD